MSPTKWSPLHSNLFTVPLHYPPTSVTRSWFFRILNQNLFLIECSENWRPRSSVLFREWVWSFLWHSGNDVVRRWKCRHRGMVPRQVEGPILGEMDLCQRCSQHSTASHIDKGQNSKIQQWLYNGDKTNYQSARCDWTQIRKNPGIVIQRRSWLPSTAHHYGLQE